MDPKFVHFWCPYFLRKQKKQRPQMLNDLSTSKRNWLPAITWFDEINTYSMFEQITCLALAKRPWPFSGFITVSPVFSKGKSLLFISHAGSILKVLSKEVPPVEKQWCLIAFWRTGNAKHGLMTSNEFVCPCMACIIWAVNNFKHIFFDTDQQWPWLWNPQCKILKL